MSQVNIMRAVDNIRSGTNVYTPLVETIVNAIQAIEATDRSAAGGITVTVVRGIQTEFDGSLPDINGFDVSDNGIGFTQANRDAFDTLYTTNKLAEGGKGFGRFTFLKYFDDVFVDSRFRNGEGLARRTFRMGKVTELIENENVQRADIGASGTLLRLAQLKKPLPERTIPTIARTLAEKLLPYLISEDRTCPRIVLQEADGGEAIVLNEYIRGPGTPLIVEDRAARGEFELRAVDGPKRFVARVFKLYSPTMKRSRLSLVAHRREVTTTSLHQYIPEFSEEFFESVVIDGRDQQRNFIVAVYVFGPYLDDNVSVERGGFEFHKDADLFLGISQRDVEASAARYARSTVEGEVKHRQERKARRVYEYVRDRAPWHAAAAHKADLSEVPYGATDEEIDVHLHKLKYARDVRTREQVTKVLASEFDDDLEARTADLVREISVNSQSELVHYVALRRSVLDILARSLERNETGQYRSEHVVHDVVFPRKGDTDHTQFYDHNLWIIDERLNFTEFVSSDLPLDQFSSDRPDLLAFGRRIGFRGENEPSNPVTIFEFKKPGRDDFVNPSSKEDPVEQIIRYVGQIREGKYRTPKGREIQVSDNTPFFGYVVCDLTPKVRKWAEDLKDFKPMPDRLGYFRWHGSLNLYLEILSWDKLVKDATERNRVFFHKLKID